MFQNTEDGKELVIENRQLLGIFFLFAVVLGIAFVAGFMVGHGSFDFGKKTPPATAATEGSGAMTRTVEPDSTSGGAAQAPPPASASSETKPSATRKAASESAAAAGPTSKRESARASEKSVAPLPDEDRGTGGSGLYQPRTGERFWQVTAQSREKAQAVASDLIHSGFVAHVASSPEPRLFRVLVGPLKNQAEAASTRVALRDKGFNNVIARNY